MFSKFLSEAKKYTNQAIEKASAAAEQSVRIAKEKASELQLNDKYQSFVDKASQMGQNASEVIKEAIAGRPDDFTYITDRIIAMGFPGYPKHTDGEHHNSREIVAKFLETNHHDKYMIYNFSDETYDTYFFNDKVMSYDLQGLPCPPLGLLVKICLSIESWLTMDDENIVAIHCLTGKGRTLTVCACLLLWMGIAKTPVDALELCAKKRNINYEICMTPSQRRYVQYFGNLMDNHRPLDEVLSLKSITITGIPNIEDNGLRPIIDIYNSGQLIYTSVKTTLKYNNNNPENESSSQQMQTEVEVPFVLSTEPAYVYECTLPLCGNIIIRCRHLRSNGNKRSIFRCMFHTGYIQGYKLYLTKEQLDGANCDKDIPSDFSVSLVFEYTPNQIKLTTQDNPLEAFESILLEQGSTLYSDIAKKRDEISKSEQSIDIDNNNNDSTTLPIVTNNNTNTTSPLAINTDIATPSNATIGSTTVTPLNNSLPLTSTTPNSINLDSLTDSRTSLEDIRNSISSLTQSLPINNAFELDGDSDSISDVDQDETADNNSDHIDYLNEIRRLEQLLDENNGQGDNNQEYISTEMTEEEQAKLEQALLEQEKILREQEDN